MHLPEIIGHAPHSSRLVLILLQGYTRGHQLLLVEERLPCWVIMYKKADSFVYFGSLKTGKFILSSDVLCIIFVTIDRHSHTFVC